MKQLFLLALALASSTASAQTFLFAGHLDDGDAPANGSFAVDLAIVDEDGDVLWSETQTGVIVVDGNFAIDVGASAPVDIVAPPSARLQLTIDGDALPPAPLSHVMSVVRAARARSARRAATADSVGPFTADNVVTRDRLATAGQSSLPFTALTGLPAGVADGDDGADLAVAANGGLQLTARTLSLGTVNGSKLGVGAVNGGRIPDNAFNGTSIVDGAVTGAKVRDNTLTADDVSGQVPAAAVSTVPVFRVSATNCTVAAGSLVTTATCQTPSCSLGGPIGGRQGCDDPSFCTAAGLVTCNNTLLGSLVVP